jgi:hypothetical protein
MNGNTPAPARRRVLTTLLRHGGIVGALLVLPACLALPEETGDATRRTATTVDGYACPEHPYETITLETPIPQPVAEGLLGLPEAEAQTCAEQLNWGFRVVQRDGEDFPATMDYRADRVSVVVEDGVVTSVNVG